MSECPICLKKANYTTSCNHTFCKSCLYKWKQTCPLCRGHIELDWPNTRAMSKRAYVVTTIDMMVKNVRMAITSEAKLKSQINKLECKLYPAVIKWITNGEMQMKGSKVLMNNVNIGSQGITFEDLR